MTEWESLVKKQLHRAPFTIPMVADSTNEIWTDIPTKLKNDDGWHIKRIAYTIENIDPTIPLVTSANVYATMALQVHRGNENEVLLPAFHPDCIVHSSMTTVFDTAGMAIEPRHPVIIDVNELTRQQMLRAIFRTSADIAAISLAATAHLSGVIFYDLITAPHDGRTKLGIDLDEI